MDLLMRYDQRELDYGSALRAAAERVKAGLMSTQDLVSLAQKLLVREFQKNGATRYLTADELAVRRRELLSYDVEE